MPLLKWLVQELQKHNFVLPRRNAQRYCSELAQSNLFGAEQAYYRDVVIWLPDTQWEEIFLPPCPNYKDCASVQKWSWPEWPARRVFHERPHYYIMTRQYRCKKCVEKSQKEKEDTSLRINALSLTFLGWNAKSLPYLAYGRGARFPAHFSFRSGIDKSLLDLTRALMNRGIRAETVSDILTELHSLEYCEEMIDRECRLAAGEARGTLKRGL